MKTHELARALRQLASVLSKGPNIDLNDLSVDGGTTSQRDLILDGLTASFDLSKDQLADFVREYNIPIELRQRDAARDVLGKLQRYLRDHPEESRRIRNATVHGQIRASRGLMAALNTLLDTK